jgi:hypothetical protein
MRECDDDAADQCAPSFQADPSLTADMKMERICGERSGWEARFHAPLPPLGSSIIHALHQGGHAQGLVKKERPMLKGQTKNLTRQVRDALLALPDAVLMETLGRWLDGVDEHLLDWSDESCYALGYLIQLDETDKI